MFIIFSDEKDQHCHIKYMELKFQCQQCSYECQNNVTLQKHANTKHVGMVTGSKDDSIKYKCALCEDRLDTSKEYEQHISEHLEEIEEMDIESLLNGHDLFECNLCSFESGHEDSVREHLIEHVNHPKYSETTDESGYEGSVKGHFIDHANATVAMNTAKYVATKEEASHRLIDEYDNDGNYIGDDPRFM